MPLPLRSSIDQGDLALSFAHLLRDDLACGALLLDEGHHILAASPEAAPLLGLPGHLLAGKHPAHLPAPAGPLLAAVLQPPTPPLRPKPAAKPGPLAHLRLRLLELGEAQTPVRHLLLLQDLTLARRLETDIRQLDRLASVGTLAAEMAHEVKNALVAVRTFADLLLEQHPKAELAESVRHETRRIDNIVAQVLRYSRPSASTFQPVALNALVVRCLQMLTPHLQGRAITLVSRLGAEPDLVRGDEQQLEQAVVNLLLNACEAITRDGTITVEGGNLLFTHTGSALSNGGRFGLGNFNGAVPFSSCDYTRASCEQRGMFDTDGVRGGWAMAAGYTVNSTLARIPYSVMEMRATPTVTVSNANHFAFRSAAGYPCSVIQYSAYWQAFNLTVSSAPSGVAGALSVNDTYNAWLLLDAEL